MIESLLVANRGEIALRVMRTCVLRGIRTVAVHTDLDADAPHVRAADVAVRVASYLDVDEVVAAAVAAGADAVHPGYGFLSERAVFARAVVDAGLVFVGPTPEVIEQMGRKDHAREIAVRAGVPAVPHGSEAGFPVLVKAAAGGGGKGMRVVRSEAELDEAMAAARREAASSFGDDTLLVEKLVEQGRHIEVQVVGDHHGTVLGLGERDCSPQRRHQKVLEEAPAPTLTPELRERIVAAGVDLARAVGYTNAGTVEFLLDVATGEFYFLEMNTRLQVEHPVTEAVHGVDLVDLQLRVAEGESIADVRIEPTGHAIEARVYAEDAYGGFLPQAGTASEVQWPTGGVRVDHALESGQVVSTAYDPMLGKIIAVGADREAARAALVAALDDTAILGLTTNAGYLRQLVASDAFRDAAIDTATLDEVELHDTTAELARVAAAWSEARAAASAGGPWGGDGWRSAGPAAVTRVDLVVGAAEVDLVRGRVDDHEVREIGGADGRLDLVVDGDRVSAFVRPGLLTVEVVVSGQRHVLARPDAAGRHAAVSDGTLLAPMPGTVLDVRVAVGDAVTAGQVLGTLEAMKMEHALVAPFDGVVAQVGAAAGDQVRLGAVLVEVEAS